MGGGKQHSMEHPKEGRESEDSGNHDPHRVVEETGSVKS